MKIMIDNGHGVDTAGKCSPDGRLREWSYTRRVAEAVVKELRRRGYDAERVVAEDRDISLGERCRRVNRSGASLVVSIHCNAAGADGRWHSARGWSAHVHPRASDRSRRLAESLHSAAVARGLSTRRQMPSRGYWEQNLAICRDTRCPAVLTENLFQDNRDDVALLLSDDGFASIVGLHVDGITSYLSTL